MVERVVLVKTIWLIFRRKRPKGVSEFLTHDWGSRLEHVRIVCEIENVPLKERLLVVVHVAA